MSQMGKTLFVVGFAVLLSSCAATREVSTESVSPAPSPVASATAAAPSPTLPTATPREEPPAVAADPVAIAAQVATAERAVRDQGLTGAVLAWMGHLQQRAY